MPSLYGLLNQFDGCLYPCLYSCFSYTRGQKCARKVPTNARPGERYLWDGERDHVWPKGVCYCWLPLLVPFSSPQTHMILQASISFALHRKGQLFAIRGLLLSSLPPQKILESSLGSLSLKLWIWLFFLNLSLSLSLSLSLTWESRQSSMEHRMPEITESH